MERPELGRAACVAGRRVGTWRVLDLLPERQPAATRSCDSVRGRCTGRRLVADHGRREAVLLAALVSDARRLRRDQGLDPVGRRSSTALRAAGDLVRRPVDLLQIHTRRLARAPRLDGARARCRADRLARRDGVPAVDYDELEVVMRSGRLDAVQVPRPRERAMEARSCPSPRSSASGVVHAPVRRGIRRWSPVPRRTPGSRATGLLGSAPRWLLADDRVTSPAAPATRAHRRERTAGAAAPLDLQTRH